MVPVRRSQHSGARVEGPVLSGKTRKLHPPLALCSRQVSHRSRRRRFTRSAINATGTHIDQLQKDAQKA